MAGYGPRAPYHTVLDSLNSRAMVIDNGTKEIAIISLDLIMFPRLVKQGVYNALHEHGFSKNEIYLSATHTHSGFGNWEKSNAGKFIFGDFDQQNTNYLIEQIVAGVLKAKKSKTASEIGFQKIDANEFVVNRLAGEKGTKDPYLRIIYVKKENGQKGLMVSFAGHAVNLDADIWELSRDYPGILVDELENEQEIEFAMFCAGMVGSHNIDIDLPKGHERIQTTGKLLSNKISSEMDSVTYSANTTLGGIDIDIELPPSQLRITEELVIRDWLFRVLMGPLEANIKILEIGDILMIGMPCDFSGELSVNNNLDQFALDHHKNLFITSFNGNYVGYITEDSHYPTCNHDEVKTLNWVGPYKGKYFTDITRKIIESVSL